jgi:hypothetical protein
VERHLGAPKRPAPNVACAICSPSPQRLPGCGPSPSVAARDFQCLVEEAAGRSCSLRPSCALTIFK